MATQTKENGKKGFLSQAIFDSRIRSANVTGKEKWFGYFIGPMLVYMAYYTLSGTYLNQFYVDVLDLNTVLGSTVFLVLMPILSKIFDAITNIIMGQIVERTRSRQGKCRPWILVATPLIVISGALLYFVPNLPPVWQAVWVAISYNLFFSFSWTIYNMSQGVLLPRSTRNSKMRDQLSLFISMGQSMIPGSVIYIIFPMVCLPMMGASKTMWMLVMAIMSCLAIPGCLLQYYFTVERVVAVNESRIERGEETKIKTVPMKQQLGAFFSSKPMLIFMGCLILYELQMNIYSTGMPFYANYVLGTYNDGTTQMLINAIGQAPLGLGVFLLWPIVKKLGKKWTWIGGISLAAFALIPATIWASKTAAVLPSLFIRSFGMLPFYTIMAMMADCIDDIEVQKGFRIEGLSMSFYAVILTAMLGVSTGIFNGLIGATGYVSPYGGSDINAIFAKISADGYTAQLAIDAYKAAADGTYTVAVVQNGATNTVLSFSVTLIPLCCFALIGFLMAFYPLDEKKIAANSATISARRKEAIEAQGLVYFSPEEEAKLEQYDADIEAEAARVKELNEVCEKKNLSYEHEEEIYQSKKKQAADKAEAKRVSALHKKCDKKGLSFDEEEAKYQAGLVKEKETIEELKARRTAAKGRAAQ